MKTGEGQGSFSKWKKVYLSEQDDYNIAVHSNQKVILTPLHNFNPIWIIVSGKHYFKIFKKNFEVMLPRYV